MKTTLECGVCHEELFTQTKDESMSNLLNHIVRNHPEARASIREANDRIRALHNEARAVRKEICEATGYVIPGLF